MSIVPHNTTCVAARLEIKQQRARSGDLGEAGTSPGVAVVCVYFCRFDLSWLLVGALHGVGISW